ncbi:hypothetical protein CERZMDRAFT_102966 [Cercospora zeae-maydis SCOH1-5]|uniref:Uncharacterized protein n=1 Tax=Cercospora zeae-maydis SCOH1-5 TaxID=717836 RepID=A0A6A6F0D1_9PEZI|nr:hypothetical protein CERZMDRAFT_102966 [Cercospora zeae-maydis SCOH1-5]
MKAVQVLFAALMGVFVMAAPVAEAEAAVNPPSDYGYRDTVPHYYKQDAPEVKKEYSDY